MNIASRFFGEDNIHIAHKPQGVDAATISAPVKFLPSGKIYFGTLTGDPRHFHTLPFGWSFVSRGEV